MPSFSATDCALAATGNRPVATRASQSSAAAGSLSNCSAINSAWIRGTSATDGRVAPSSSWRTGRPSGTSGTPTSASRSAQSGGAHIRTSAPSPRNRTASATSGSTSPRPPYVDNNTRIRYTHFRRFWPRPTIMRHDPGLAASPPVRYTFRWEGVAASTSTTPTAAPTVPGPPSTSRSPPSGPAIRVVPKLGRLARSVPDARDIGDTLVTRGIRLSINGTIYDPTDPMGKMFFNILATFAEFEVDLLRMRTREGMAVALRQRQAARQTTQALGPAKRPPDAAARRRRPLHRRPRRAVRRLPRHRLPGPRARPEDQLTPTSFPVGWVGPGRGAVLRSRPFPRSARRTRRACLHATGAPRVFPDGSGHRCWRLPGRCPRSRDVAAAWAVASARAMSSLVIGGADLLPPEGQMFRA